MRLALLLIAGVVYGQTASQPTIDSRQGFSDKSITIGDPPDTVNQDIHKLGPIQIAIDDLAYKCDQNGICVHVNGAGVPDKECVDGATEVVDGVYYQCQSKGWVSNPVISDNNVFGGEPNWKPQQDHETAILFTMAGVCIVALILTAIMGFRLGRASRQREDDQQDRREALMNSNLELKDIPAGGILRIGDLPMYRMELGRKPEVTPDTSYEALMKLYDEDPEEFMRITSMCQSGGAETVKIDEPKTFGEPFRFSEPQDPGEFIPYRKKLYPLPARDSKGRFLPKEKKA